MELNRGWRDDEDGEFESRLVPKMFQMKRDAGSHLMIVKTLFGLRDAQTRVSGIDSAFDNKKLFHNAGWYNRKGEEIGWGDLSVKDLKNIKGGLRTGELFIVMSEINRSDKKDYIHNTHCIINSHTIYFIKNREGVAEEMGEKPASHLEVS